MNVELIRVEKGAYIINFEALLAECAEEIIIFLESASESICEIYSMKVPYMAEIYLFENTKSYELYKVDNTISDNSITIVMDWIKNISASLFVLRELGNLIFNSLLSERKNTIRQWRSPSWIKEGFSQSLLVENDESYKLSLKEGWNTLQSLTETKGIIPFSLMEKDINYIPNPERRHIALVQAFYMKKLLIRIIGNGFIKKYSDLMKNNLNKQASEAFHEVTNLTFEQFYGMFKICVENNAALN